MPFNAKRERRLLEAARRGNEEHRYFDDLREALESGELKPRDFSIKKLFQEFVEDGRELVESFSTRKSDGCRGVNLVESGINTGDYANIIGQIVYTEILDEFEGPVFLSPRLARNVPTEFSGERIPGIGGLGDAAEVVEEMGSYPLIGNSEHWIDTPQTEKRGFIVPVSKEAIFFDRTARVLMMAGETGRWFGVNKEKRILDAVFGITNNYRRNGAEAINTYGENSGAHNFDNLAASNALVDWTDVETAELLFDGLRDPNTDEPIAVMPSALIVPSALVHTARRIISATEVRHAGGGIETLSSSPISQYEIMSNQYVKDRTGSDSTWFIGSPMEAFWYMENWAIESTEAPANSEVEFTNDIVNRFKVSERGVIIAKEPRQMVKSTA